MDKRVAYVLIAAAVVATWAVGSLAAVGSGDDYGQLEQPAWAPPGVVFGPVWTVLYILIAVAGILLWRQQGQWTKETALFGAQLFVNALWTPLFFAWELRGLALAWILLLDVLVLVLILRVWRIRPLVGGLLLPYLAWIMFATALNGAVWWLNRA